MSLSRGIDLEKHMSASLLDHFASTLENETINSLHDGLIGHDAEIDGPFGSNKMVYADYVASGRALHQIESFILNRVLPFYANSHTEASHVGATMTKTRREARDVIRSCCNATQDHAVIFTGSGTTQGINRLVHLFGVSEAVKNGENPLVIIGPYEHHSNILPWRESGAEVVQLPEGERGGPCMRRLEEVLRTATGRSIVATLSAASNVTGILTDVEAVTRRLKQSGAKVIWDYAGGAPYLPIDMCPADDALIDAVALSAHKFVGGPQASGVLIVRHDAVKAEKPTLAGGGTVRFVSPTSHDYSGCLEAREEAGTPNVVGDIRAALCFMVKRHVGQQCISERNAKNVRKAMAAWRDDPNIKVLGRLDCDRLPIFAFRIGDGDGGYIHQQLVTRLLSDRFGIQARGGCACAGPYVHSLMDICDSTSNQLRDAILAGQELEKPGFVRLNLSYLAGDDEVDFLINSVREIARDAAKYVQWYSVDHSTAIFSPVPARQSA